MFNKYNCIYEEIIFFCGPQYVKIDLIQVIIINAHKLNLLSPKFLNLDIFRSKYYFILKNLNFTLIYVQ